MLCKCLFPCPCLDSKSCNNWLASFSPESCLPCRRLCSEHQEQGRLPTHACVPRCPELHIQLVNMVQAPHAEKCIMPNCTSKTCACGAGASRRVMPLPPCSASSPAWSPQAPLRCVLVRVHQRPKASTCCSPQQRYVARACAVHRQCIYSCCWTSHAVFVAWQGVHRMMPRLLQLRFPFGACKLLPTRHRCSPTRHQYLPTGQNNFPGGYLVWCGAPANAVPTEKRRRGIQFLAPL